MSTIFKIRLLLVTLTISFFVTASMIRLTHDRNEILLQDARKMEQRLHEKETLIKGFIHDQTWMDKLKSINSSDRQYADEVIDYLTTKHHILVNTYQANRVQFWSSVQTIPDATLIRSDLGAGLLRLDNGWYFSIRHQEDDFTADFLIPVKSNYSKTNVFLENKFSTDLIKSNNLDIAEYADRSVYSIRDTDGQYLFSVKMNSHLSDTYYSDLELIMWILGGIFTLALLHIFCTILAKRGLPWMSVVIFGLLLTSIRLAEQEFNWFATNFNSGIFDPRYYASSELFPHLGGFLLTLLFLTWFLAYTYLISKWLKLPKVFYSPVGATVLSFLLAVALFIVCFFINSLFQNLVSNSSINFDVTDILNLDTYSWLGILALSFAMLGILFAMGVAIQLAVNVLPETKSFYRNQGAVFGVILFILIGLGFFSVYVLLFASLLVLLTWYAKSGQKYIFVVSISVLLIMATVASLKQAEFQKERKREAQKRAIQQLEDIDDINALAMFLDMEQEIMRDSIIINNFRRPNADTRARVMDHLTTTYFSGYLSRYEVRTDLYDHQFRPFSNSSGAKLTAFRERVISGANKVSGNFYRGNSSFGNFEYFAQFPITLNDEFLGVLLIDINHRSYIHHVSYPGVLADSRLDYRQTEMMAEYAYAIYRSGELISQEGRYIYPVTDSLYLPLGTREYTHVGSYDGYSHMAYQPDDQTTIVLSKPGQGGWMQFASISFFFLIFLCFFIVVFLLTWLLATISTSDFSLRNLRWRYLVISNRILYSTRIQLLIVVAVIFTLIVAGIITFFSVSNQFVKQQRATILQNAWNLTKAFESTLLENESTIGMDHFDEFQNIAAANALDLNLYTTDGRLIFSTQPRIYDLRLIADYIHPSALNHLHYLARSQYIQQESIGGMNFLNAYTSIRNAEHEPIAFLSLPYYVSDLEFEKSTRGLLNTLINIYTMVILVLGLFAVFVANKITEPLLLVQRSLAKTKIGKQNEPIFWKRNDEMGKLIKEYNLMIAELEQSAVRIMQSERESAWKEMARQVAHEIRNPLTPLKLGMQQLERSWLDKDPGFEERFKRFIESFIEQIDGLTRIATEFSDFAKMPDAQFAEFDLVEVIRNSVTVFDSHAHVTIKLNLAEDAQSVIMMGDKDQLLRAFNNLIKNSIEASTNLRRCIIKINVSIESDQTVVEIEDNGEGIPKDVRRKLFQPNFTTKSSGTGLGLAFVKRAIEVLDGTISYHTTLGKGTSFILRFPKG